MGSSCSLHQRHLQYEQSVREQRLRRRRQTHRCRSKVVQKDSKSTSFQDGMESEDTYHSSLRYAVVTTIPDITIPSLYPIEENFLLESTLGLRSPKSLADLACDTVCRNLPFMKCDLPRGLPQDVVDDIYNSLIRNRALNSTTLKAFRNCEVGTIEFSNCRGVTDEWLEHLSSSQNETDYDWKNQFTENKQPVICTNLSYPSVAIMQRDFVSSQKLDVTVDIDEQGVSTNKGESFSTAVDTQQQPADGKLQINENSSWSTSSFLSASSNQQECTHMALSIDSYDDTDQGMDDYVEKDKVKEDERRPSMDETELSDTSSNQKMPQSEISVVYTTEGFGHSTTESYFVSPNLTSIEPHFCATVNTKVLDLRGCQSLTDRGLILLTNLYNLEEAYFDDCHSLSGRGLSALSKSQNLHLVSLRNCRRLTDDGIIHLSQSNRFLETFILEGCRCLTDRSMFSISSCTNLGKLDLSQCDLISDDGLKQLKELRKLTYLNLGWCRKITDHGLDTLTSQPGRRDNLIELVLARCISISDIGIEYLTRLLNLERLYVNGCKAISSTVLGRTIQNLKKLTTLDASYMPGILRTGWQGKLNTLKRLDLRYSSVKDAQLTSWFNLPTLEELFLASCAVSDVAIGHLSDRDVVPNLTVLDLADTNITDVGVSKICKLTKLKRLSLFYCNITDNALKDVAKLENLEVLNLDSRDLSDDGLYHIHNMTKLRELDVYSCRLTDKGCFYISEISSLQSLELCGGGITDLGCSILAGLENLTHLNLSQNERITNRGAAALAVLASLRSLNLSHTRVNSTGLRFFTSLCNLQSLSLFGCAGIDDDANNGIMNLQDNLPKLRCIRSDRTPALDGMFLPDCDDEEFSNDENCVGCEIMWRVESDITHEIAMQGRETDETSEFSDHD